jgi:hypothetical protein
MNYAENDDRVRKSVCGRERERRRRKSKKKTEKHKIITEVRSNLNSTRNFVPRKIVFPSSSSVVDSDHK